MSRFVSAKVNVRGVTALAMLGAALTVGILLAAANLFASTEDHSLSCTLSTISFYVALLAGLFILAAPVAALVHLGANQPSKEGE